MYYKKQTLATHLIRALHESASGAEELKELREAQTAHETACFKLRHCAPVLMLAPDGAGCPAETYRSAVLDTRDALMHKIHNALNFLFQQAKAETATSPFIEA